VKQNLDFAALLWDKAQASVGRFLDEKGGGDTFQLAAELGSWLQVVGCSTRAAESSPVEFDKLLLSDEP